MLIAALAALLVLAVWPAARMAALTALGVPVIWALAHVPPAAVQGTALALLAAVCVFIGAVVIRETA